METTDREKIDNFLAIFCDCYSEYAKAIETLGLKNRSHFREEVSPYQFLTYHNAFKQRILSNDISVLGELSYLSRWRCLSLDHSNALALMMFLSNLCVYAKLATKSFKKLTTEEQVMGENILNRHLQRQLDIAAAKSSEETAWKELFEELPQDIDGMLNGPVGENLNKQITALAAQSPSGAVNPFDIINILTRGGGDEGAPQIDVMGVIGKISERLFTKINSGQLDEDALMRQTVLLMKNLPSAGRNNNTSGGL